ncbi:MAG: class I SAM-dependent methyltransferase, partial [Nanoarchaeota archaeon]
ILEIDKEFRRKEKFIAECLLETNPNVKTVVRKQGSHEGTFRRQKMKYLAGDDKKETLHKENGIQLLLDIEKVYFSARQSTERRRIADQVKNGERVLVLFSGCAPFVCVIAKNSNPRYVCGVELNPVGHKYAVENIKLNKFNNVFLSNRDAKKTKAILKDFSSIPEFDPHFDRIVMPLPKSAEEFLDEALFFSKHGTVIHFYDFLDEKDFHLAHKKIEKACQRNLLKPKILDTVKCGQHSPHVFRICVDFMVY